jgi:CRISPR-associated endonuclease/helicase Cas3
MISFEAFFTALNDGFAPYPWQTALARRLADERPPRAVVVPTGGGKTATLDALVWALAVQADRPVAERTIGVRTVWAIDRRIIVDEVHARAERIASRLHAAKMNDEDPLLEVANRLSSFTDGVGTPLETLRWRGQLRIDVRRHHPLQPQVITSTVAQIGSRLLFRGYGVAERSRALEAGLAAVDTTICLDEAHLAEPFRQTVEAVRAARKASEPARLLGPLTTMILSATPLTGEFEATNIHGITGADEGTLASRLDAPKCAVLVEPEGEHERQQVTALLTAVAGHLARGTRRIACVVNSVRLAASVAEGAHASLGDDVDAIVLVGPQRPWDRRELIAAHERAIFDRETPRRPLVVIATQTIEVGLDADFEAMVTQSASASALVQRAGRLNRAGLDPDGRLTIVRDRESTLYGPDESVAWDWLCALSDENGTIDFSPRAIARAGGPPTDQAPAWAPALTAETIELWQQTAPAPAPTADPAVEPFLRGIDEPPADDVLVAWRDDLRLEDQDEESRLYRRALLTLAPPHSDELVSIGLRRFHVLVAARFGDPSPRSSLARLAIQEADLEGGIADERMTDTFRVAAESRPPRFIVMRDREVYEVGTATADLRQRDVRPGDVIVLESAVGGYAHSILAPSSGRPVIDIGNRVAVAASGLSGRRGVRLGEEHLRRAFPVNWRTILQAAGQIVDQDAPADDARWRALLAAIDLDPETRVRAARRVGGRTTGGPAEIWDDEPGADSLDEIRFDDEEEFDGGAFVLVLDRDLDQEAIRSPSLTPPTLAAHVAAVADRTRKFASALPDASVRRSLQLAACAHDHGKADERFQSYLRRGSARLGDELLAKSADGTDDRVADERARRAAGLPRGLRHEIASVAVLADHMSRMSEDDLGELDDELALHLVGTHHGLGRPWPRLPRDGAPSRVFSVALAGVGGSACGDGVDGWQDGAWLRRFFSVSRRYGPWGMAYLEAILMLADRSVSAEGG